MPLCSSKSAQSRFTQRADRDPIEENSDSWDSFGAKSKKCVGIVVPLTEVEARQNVMSKDYNSVGKSEVRWRFTYLENKLGLEAKTNRYSVDMASNPDSAPPFSSNEELGNEPAAS
ncbi:hypothetical protein Nepgr_023627 [Nepenthes gracilis]|uniref:Uncharacterized protein n=1 Tax=Nepenthes gracilis TaxID=150966 RepID=A0AAD3T1K6_NEPGR|nr:hypothetical protein Nepgr_023627 [Nepenthes gracilis]